MDGTPPVSTFTTPLDVEYLDGRNWRLIADFEFASDVLERIVRIPAGFVTDFASIPRPLWALLPPTGPYGKPAVVHDMLYRFPACVTPTVTFREANAVLLEGMIALRVGLVTRTVIVVGVQLFGWIVWHQYRSGSV